jgi:hypothetical protein
MYSLNLFLRNFGHYRIPGSGHLLGTVEIPPRGGKLKFRLASRVTLSTTILKASAKIGMRYFDRKSLSSIRGCIFTEVSAIRNQNFNHRP